MNLLTITAILWVCLAGSMAWGYWRGSRETRRTASIAPLGPAATDDYPPDRFFGDLDTPERHEALQRARAAARPGVWQALVDDEKWKRP